MLHRPGRLSSRPEQAMCQSHRLLGPCWVAAGPLLDRWGSALAEYPLDILCRVGVTTGLPSLRARGRACCLSVEQVVEGKLPRACSMTAPRLSHFGRTQS